jgi:cbb3-type cytochrome oxidase maturation protein
MSILLVLILISMLVAGSFLAAFIWAVKSGQYNDTYSPAVRILFEEKGNASKKSKNISDEIAMSKSTPEGRNINDVFHDGRGHDDL